MNKIYKGYIFDCDGTLVNSMPAHFEAWHSTLLKYGLNFTEKRFYELGGVPTEKIIQILADEAKIEIDVVTVAQEKESQFLKGVHLVEPVNKVVHIANEVRINHPIAVATGASQEVAKLELTQIGIYSWFQAIISADDVHRPKPFPDVYLEAAHQIHILPEECRAFEDTDLGIQAAQAAGMDVIDVRTL